MTQKPDDRGPRRSERTGEDEVDREHVLFGGRAVAADLGPLAADVERALVTAPDGARERASPAGAPRRPMPYTEFEPMDLGVHDTELAVHELLAPPVDLASTQPQPSPWPATGKLGRFTLLEPLASGAMGVVYTAYDETLDRKVAVKVLRDTGDSAQVRLLREAQAMARVSHPNVVTVLEAGVAGGQVYVAMEFIRGLTLAAWLAEQPRSWQQVLGVFRQAGRGLAAAHEAGLVHRDFKPSNVMIDELGRARVLDFGLVRVATPLVAPAASVSASHNHLDIHLTDDDQIVGTPAYMAPEQWRGLSPEPASDQFSFCVALYEALYGAPPFQFNDITELVRRVLRGQVCEPPRKLVVPTRLAAVVLRGLKPAAKDRYPGMPALLAALEQRLARGWRRWLAPGAALAACAATAGFVVARPEAAEVTCAGAPEAIAPVWGPGRRDRVATALRAAVPDYAAVLWPRVAGALDRYAGLWRETHQDACLGHLRGERSGALLDQQMRCLDQRLRALDVTVASLESADLAVSLRALEVTGQLPALDRCRDLTALASERPPPVDPDLAAQVSALRHRMTEAEVLARSGRLHDAVALATEVVSLAEPLAYGPALAEALLVRGRLGLNLPSETDERIDWLTRAIAAGFAARTDAIAAEALALRIFALARQPGEVAHALADEPLALALAARSDTPEVLRGLVLNNIGTVHLARQDQAAARRYFTEALAVRETALGGEHREVGYTLVNLALASEPGPQRERLLARALEIFEHELGPAHPETIEVRLTAAHLVDPVAGSALVRPGCVALDRFLTDDVVSRSRCLLYLGRLATELGAEAEAETSFLGAAALAARAAVASVPLTEFEVAALAGYAALGVGEHEGAIETIEAALHGLPEAWWSQADAAELRLVLGQNLRAAGHLDAAIASLEASVTAYDELAAAEPQFNPARARAHRSLAEALLSRGGEAAEVARRHLAAAREFYGTAGAGFARQLATTERLISRATTAVPNVTAK